MSEHIREYVLMESIGSGVMDSHVKKLNDKQLPRIMCIRSSCIFTFEIHTF